MSDDDFGRRLRDGIPEPRAGYWQDLQATLGRIEAEQDFDEPEGLLDTQPVLSRPTDMNNTNPPNSNSRLLFAAAAALLLVVGLGAAALIYRGNETDDVTEVDVASQPDGDTQSEGGTTDPASSPEPTSEAEPTAVAGVVFADTASPVGGTVKKATLSGPETAMMVVCDQSGFEPFLFEDQGSWVGCQLPAGGTAGGESALEEPVLTEAAGPVGGLVAQLVIPGPQSSVIVECAGGFTPFLFTDQGTWVGCQST